MGAYAKRAGPWNLDAVCALFPMLKEKSDESRYCALRRPATNDRDRPGVDEQSEAVICDELSLGLAPVVVKEIYDALPRICSNGMTAIIVEQDIGMAQKVSSRLYCLQEGRVTLTGASDELSREQISHAYFGNTGLGTRG
jgi:branched-chain amino acid transport system ATP-binding protein